MRSLVVILWLLFASLLVAGGARADSTQDVRDGMAAKASGDRARARPSLEKAAASEDVDASAQATYFLAEMDDEDLLFARALERYRASVLRSPSHRYAPRAMTRADLLRRHAEGDFAPYVRLEQVRRDPALANAPEAIDALARDAESFPPGLVRVEARTVVAEAYLGRMHRRTDGITVLRKVVNDPAADPLTVRQASRELVDALVAEGDLAGAAEAAHAGDPKLARDVRTLVRRRNMHVGAISALSVFAILAVGVVARARSRLPVVGLAVRSWTKIALPLVAWMTIVGGMLASQYERGRALPFVLLGAAVFVLTVLARAWGAAGSRAPVAKAVRAVLSAASVVAAAFLVLESLDTGYLEGFGL